MKELAEFVDLTPSALAVLSNREIEILRLYFGLNGLNQMTLEEIGVKFDLGKERIRQIKEIALRKMRCTTPNETES